MIKFKSLNKNAQFLDILKKKKINTKYFSVFFRKKIIHKKSNQCLNISFVLNKKVGNSVVRNKIKRKLKAAVQKIIREKQPIDLNYTYVIFGRNNVYKDKFQLIFNEVNDVFKQIKKEPHRQ